MVHFDEQRIREAAGGHALIAVDQELGGIQRLHDLTTPLLSATEAAAADGATIEAVASDLAAECRELGVNVVLSPIVDVLSGPNPWLERRTLSGDADVVRWIASAFVQGLQASGRVAATAKHFPGIRVSHSILQSTNNPSSKPTHPASSRPTMRSKRSSRRVSES